MRTRIIGIIGGGQLARMLIQAGISWPVKFHVYAQSSKDPACNLTNQVTIGDLQSFDDLVSFGQNCDILTIEIENVNIDALQYLQLKYKKQIYPDPEILEQIRDRVKQKILLDKLNISQVKWTCYENPKEVANITYPCVNKLALGGYDGHGTRVIKNNQDKLFEQPSILEAYCKFDKELAICVARNSLGEIALLPIVQTYSNNANMLDYLVTPELAESTSILIREIATSLVTKLNYIGILTLELFQVGNLILVNELAPRPHNTGHLSQDYCNHSQFDLLIKCLLGMSLPQINMRTRLGALVNILGSGDGKGAIYSNLELITNLDNTYCHIYDKQDCKHNRKMGHVNILAFYPQELENKLKQVKELLSNCVVPDLDKNKNKLSLVPVISIIMGSSSDLEVMQGAVNILTNFGVPHEIKIISAHRAPEEMIEYAKTAYSRNLKCIIAGAGGSAHLPGMVASCTSLPVIGVPIKSSNSLDGWDSMLSIIQMPAGIPVATVGLDNSTNAGLLACRILGLTSQLDEYRVSLKEKVKDMNKKLENPENL